MKRNLFSYVNAKVSKGLRPRRGTQNYLTGVMYLAPADVATPPGKTLCPQAGACKAACLAYSGHGGMGKEVRAGRIARVNRFLADPDQFLDDIRNNIRALLRYCSLWARRPTKAMRSKGITRMSHPYTPCVRLNGTSDIPWERYGLFEEFPDIQFYDYTKNAARMFAWLNGRMAKNYHLTFSLGGTQDSKVPEILGEGGDVTVAFDGPKPSRWGGSVSFLSPRGRGKVDVPITPCIDGDIDDLRFLDPGEKAARGIRGGAIVALKFKTITDTVRAARLAVIREDEDEVQFTQRPGLFTPMPEFDSEELRQRSQLSRANPDDQALSMRFGCGGFGVTVEDA